VSVPLSKDMQEYLQTHGPSSAAGLYQALHLQGSWQNRAEFNRQIRTYLISGQLIRKGLLRRLYYLPSQVPPKKNVLDAEPITQGPIEQFITDPIIFIVRLFVFVAAIILWIVVIGPIWLVMLLRTIGAYSWLLIISLFRNLQRPSEDRIYFIVAFYIHGFVQIIGFLTRQPAARVFPAVEYFNPWQELAIAMIFYIYVATAIIYFPYWIAFLEHIFSIVWQILYSIYEFIVYLKTLVMGDAPIDT
jgi:hypothetical protein